MRTAGVSIVETNGAISISPSFLQGNAPKNVGNVLKAIADNEPEAAYAEPDKPGAIFKFGKRIVYFDDPDITIKLGDVPPDVIALADQVSILGNLKSKLKGIILSLDDSFEQLVEEEDESKQQTAAQSERKETSDEEDFSNL